ncbi:hypothetical protein MMPV_009876, partial [Pyropia vietnamensis]
MAVTPDSGIRMSSRIGGRRHVRLDVALVAVATSIVAAVGTIWWLASNTFVYPADGSPSAVVGGHGIATSAAGIKASSSLSRAPRLVFIDAGGNTGQTVEWFRNGTALAGDIFRSVHHTTTTDPNEYEVVVFEPNPVLAPYYEALRTEKGLDFSFIPAAVADADGWVDFSG